MRSITLTIIYLDQGFPKCLQLWTQKREIWCLPGIQTYKNIAQTFPFINYKTIKQCSNLLSVMFSSLMDFTHTHTHTAEPHTHLI